MQDSYAVQCQHILQAVIASTDNGRGVAGEFMDLPDKKLAPNYYAVIPEPICLNTIRDRLKKKNHYKHPEDFIKDLHLVFLNAKYYNQEKSVIYKDATMLERLIFYIYSRLVAKGVLPEVRDETLSKVLDPPRTKGRPPKNSLLDQYKAQHPDIAAVVKAKPQSTGVKANTYSSSLTTVEPLVSAETNGAEAAPPTTPATVPSLLPVPAQTPSQSNDGGSAAQGTAVQGVSPNSLPTPSRISHAAGQSRLIAPPPPLTFPQVEIPDKIRGLDDQDEINIEENAKARDELDKVLDKWPGPAENIPAEVNDEGNRIPGSGWWGDEYHGQLENWQQLAMEIIEKLRTYLDTDGNRPCSAIEQLPPVSNIQYLSFRHPLSLQIIANNLISGVYSTMKAYDMEMTRLFEKARRYYQRVTQPYGHVLAIQRLYNALTSMYESQDIEQGTPPPSALSYASFPAGPGNAKPLGDNGVRNDETKEFTSFRVGTRDRMFTSMAKYKGMTYKIGDYVHIINPDDASRPIPAQVYRSYIPKGQTRHMVTVCWYFRPEQIVHLPTHLFYEDEVFKTGHMVDHPVEDIMERVGCQFFTKYIRGRPLKGEWYPGWPLYICVARYNEKEHLTVRIKNWNSCIPEELRKSDFMQVTTFEKAPHTLRLYKSPFLLGTQPGTRGVTGYLSDTVGQTPTEKKGLRGDSATGDDEAAHPGMTPNPSTERAAKKARIEEKSPLGVHANPHMQSEQGSSHPSMIGPTSTIAAQISMSTGPSTGHAPTGSSGIPGFSTPGASRQLPATAAVSGYNAQADNRGPPTPQSPFGGPHQIVPLNRSNPLPYQPQMMSNLPNLQPPRQINLPATGQPRPQGYSHAPGGFSLNTHPIKPISNTQPSYQYHAQTPGQGVPARSQLPPHGQAQGSVPPVVQVANVATPRGADKSLATLFGGPQELDRLCDTEMLPESTVNMLDRDPVTNRVFWFSGPPIHVDVPEKPKHSATYLAHLAQNRLRFALGQMMDPGTAAGEGEVVASADIVEEGKGQWSAVAEEVAHFMNAE